MILLGAYQGLRASEIAAVHADDIDLDAGTLKVLGKGGRLDYLPLHDVIRELASTMGDGWWFPARGNRTGHIKGQSVSDLLHDARERAGITDKHLTGHSLRHSFGTELVRQGANIRAVQEVMRHASLQTTQRYTQVLDADRKAAVSVLASRRLLKHSGRGGVRRVDVADVADVLEVADVADVLEVAEVAEVADVADVADVLEVAGPAAPLACQGLEHAAGTHGHVTTESAAWHVLMSCARCDWVASADLCDSRLRFIEASDDARTCADCGRLVSVVALPV